MEDIPLCPDWWPKLLWDLHFVKVPWPHPPVNMPAALEAILLGLQMHTSSYRILDQKAAALIREAAVKSIIEAAQDMEKLHNEAVGAHVN